MKPNFALTFSSEGLRLLQRAPSGWLLVGDVGFDAEDLPAEMAALRANAARLEPSALFTKLVVPNDQIKFLTVPSTAKTEAEAEADAAQALEGATPYDLADLAFDWAMDDGQLFIAAVARQTLLEAESFANEHQFAPVSFVALPEQSTFAGEPFFGVAKSARNLTPAIDSVTRDLQPIHVIGAAEIPEPEPAPLPEPEPQPTPDPEPEPKQDPAADAAALPQEPETKDAPSEALTQEIKEASEPDPAPVAAPLAFSSVRASREAPAAPGKPFKAPKDVMDSVTSPVVAPDTSTPVPAATARKGKLTLTPPAPPKPETPKTAPAPKTDKPQNLTLFGLRKPATDPQEIGGKPKNLGLALTAALLLFMVIIAIWASFISEDGLAGLFGRSSEEVQVAAIPDGATDEELAEAADVEPAGDVSQGPNAPAATEAIALPDLPHLPSPEEAEQSYIATGIWQIAPEQPLSPEAGDAADVYLASIDPTVAGVDAIALPDVGAQHDLPPQQRLNPVAAGTTYDLDERGLVKATPEGALTPDGITVFAGPPALVPPKTPTRFEQSPSLEEETRLATKRPLARPDNLQEKTERGQLGGRSRTELAALRPRLRPETDKQKAERDETPTAQAVALSLKPKTRPSGFSSIVKKTTRTKKETVRTASAPAASPGIPSSASVARQATVKNALNLRQVNLIGVYGKASNRRALIRLSSGRYKKVKIGDRIDGGKVAAISESELRYVKNGRNVVLKMPRG